MTKNESNDKSFEHITDDRKETEESQSVDYKQIIANLKEDNSFVIKANPLCEI